MKSRLMLAVAALPLWVTALTAGPPVTSPKAPSPGAEVARRWLTAAFRAPLLTYADESVPRSEAVRMLMALQNVEPLGPGAGWFDPSRRRHDWTWLAQHFDGNGDGGITRKEFGASIEFFTRLDRNQDGTINADDLDWSEDSAWVQENAKALRLFRMMDRDGDGRVTDEEIKTYFEQWTGERETLNGQGYLTAEEFREALSGNPPRRGNGRSQGKRASRETWLRCLMEGDLGSPLEGPRVWEEAPDFTLTTHDGKGEITLSDFRGKKPVVLIFGSFT